MKFSFAFFDIFYYNWKVLAFHGKLSETQKKSSATAGNTAGWARAMQGKLKQDAGIIKCVKF